MASIRNERWNEISALFDELVELPAGQRDARLGQVEPALAAEVRALLLADDGAQDDTSLLEDGASAALPELLAEETGRQGGMLGPYRLLHPIGEGGMGIVWLAERADGAYEHRVAIKRLKRGMDSHAILHRFLQERRILARLQHPHIVRLLDAGLGADGQPYYVMEFVDGVPLPAYATRHRLAPRERADLLAKVADAVAYAHAHLVVHRDLKPSNVLVDADGAPRVLDFGIAKLIEQSSEQTATGLRMLSPAYAAPEQILGEPIGTPTDVYVLGLLLCELMTGELPHRRTGHPAWLAQDALAEATRASTLAARLSTERVHELYGNEVSRERLSRSLAGDVDVIIETALQRDPARRYVTAAAFARDVRNWLDGRPINARASSTGYRLRRFVLRHRLGVAAGVMVTLSLVTGLAVALSQARIARTEAQRADAARHQAERQLERAEHVKQFILTLFREPDPVARAQAQARTPMELVRAGIEEAEASLASQPELQADLLRDLGEIQIGLDEAAAGRATLELAWERQKRLSGESGIASIEAQAALAEAIYLDGDGRRAWPMLRDAVDKLHAAGLGRRPRTAQAEATLALIELVNANNAEAERLARHAVESDRGNYGADSLQVALRLSTLGKVLQEISRHDEALQTYRQALALVVAKGGEDHARAAMLHAGIGDVLRVQRRYADALPEYQAAERIERKQLPPGHSILGATLIRLGDLQRRMRRLDEADRSLSEAIEILAMARSGQYAQALQFHGHLMRAQGRFDLAVQRYLTSFEVFRERTGESIYTWLTALLRVEALIDAGRLHEADTVASEAHAALARMPEDPYAKIYEASAVGSLRHVQGRHAEAVALRRQGLDGLLRLHGDTHADVPQARIALAASLIADGDTQQRAEAKTLLAQARTALDLREDAEAEALLGRAMLENSRILHAEGDTARARAELPDALQRLGERPEDARILQDARAFARVLSQGGA